MQLSLTTSSTQPPTSTLPPYSFQQRHCAPEDWCRYLGGSVAFIGSAWCFSDDAYIPGSLLGLVGLTIVIVHITDKNCGARVKLIRAANEILGKYSSLFKTVDSAAGQLEHIEERHKNDHLLLATETTALTAETKDIQQSAEDLQSHVSRYAEENTRLQGANQELRQTIEFQEKRIEELQMELEKFTEQNNRFHQELGKITKTVAELSSTEMKFQANLTGFDTKIAQMQQIPALILQMQKEKEELQRKIEELQGQIEQYKQTKESLKEDVQAIEQMHKTAKETSSEIGSIATQLEAQKEIFLASQKVLKELIAKYQKPEDGTS